MTNLILHIQKNLGYPELHKIDPNTQDVKPDEKIFGTHTNAQAAIPAVICGICSRLNSSEGVELIMAANHQNSIDMIFGKEKTELINRIAEYSNTSNEVVCQECEHVANEAVRLIKEHLPGTGSPGDIAFFLNEQRANALLYLPASIQLGRLINDNQLDDRTHKMQGPVSSLMHVVEKQF